MIRRKTMTLRHWEIFLAVCEQNSMTRTAEKLHMTQPSVSQAIKELEEHYDTRLFDRLGKRLYLTDAGKTLLHYTRQILSLRDETEQTMRTAGRQEYLRLGASITVGQVVLLDFLRHLRENRPQTKHVSVIHNTSHLEKMLLNDTLDAALVEGEIHSPYLTEEPFMRDELILVADPDTDIDTITTETLPSLPFYLREEGSGTRLLFEQVMRSRHIPYHIAGVFNNTADIKTAVEYGLGRHAVSRELDKGRLKEIPLSGLSFQRDFRLVLHKDKHLTPALEYLIAYCRGLT